VLEREIKSHLFKVSEYMVITDWFRSQIIVCTLKFGVDLKSKVAFEIKYWRERKKMEIKKLLFNEKD